MTRVTMYRGTHPDGEKGMLARMGNLVAISHDEGDGDVWETPEGSGGFEHPKFWSWEEISKLQADIFSNCTVVWTHDFYDVDTESLAVM